MLQPQLRLPSLLGVLGMIALSITACSPGTTPPSATAAQPGTGAPSAIASQQEPSAAGATPTLEASASPDATTVTISGISFGPPEISVPVGELRFVNADAVPHTVTEGQNGAAAPAARFDEVVAAGDTIVITLEAPGDYQITCQFHPQMHLVVHAK